MGGSGSRRRRRRQAQHKHIRTGLSTHLARELQKKRRKDKLNPVGVEATNLPVLIPSPFQATGGQQQHHHHHQPNHPVMSTNKTHRCAKWLLHRTISHLFLLFFSVSHSLLACSTLFLCCFYVLSTHTVTHTHTEVLVTFVLIFFFSPFC